MRAALVICLLAGCEVDRHVTLQLGPNAKTVTTGFTCKDPDMPNLLLFQKAYANQQLQFQLVVDLIDVGAHVPSCLPEDVASTCSDGSCRVTLMDAPVRFCKTITVPLAQVTTIAEISMAVTDQLSTNFPTIFPEAPHHPVIVRAVATQQPCDTIMVSSDQQTWDPVERGKVLGCAYSCPVGLDQIDGTVSLGINVSTTNITAQQCQTLIEACAEFPNNLAP